MSVINLTSGIVAIAHCPEGKQKAAYHDRAVPGFVLNVSRHGTKSFAYRYRDSSGRQREQHIGRVSYITVAEARAKAVNLRARMRRPAIAVPSPSAWRVRGAALVRGLQRFALPFG